MFLNYRPLQKFLICQFCYELPRSEPLVIGLLDGANISKFYEFEEVVKLERATSKGRTSSSEVASVTSTEIEDYPKFMIIILL